MNSKQYNNIINCTLADEHVTQNPDSLTVARTIFNNMGVALPNGTMPEIVDVLKTNDYMGWRACTPEEAQQAANSGIPTIGISDNQIVVIAADDKEDPVSNAASVATLSEENSVETGSQLEHYVYSMGTTSTEEISTDPFEKNNIQFIRIKKYDMSSLGGDSDITSVVTKSTLSADQYFEAFAPNRSNIAYVIDQNLIDALNAQEAYCQKYALMQHPSYQYHLAKLGVDKMVSEQFIEDQSAEYYGIWASEANRLLVYRGQIESLIQLTCAVVSLAYNIYNIVTAIKNAKMAANSTQVFLWDDYVDAADDVDGLFQELSNSNAKFTKENTMWIVRKPDGRICWLETGNGKAGFNHILAGHPVSEFASLGVNSEAGVSSLIFNTVSTKMPVGTYGAGGTVYALGNQKYLNVVFGTNGFIVNAYNVSNNISGINFY